MFDQILHILTESNKALLGQNAVITLLLAVGGGYAVGQIVKLPLKVFLHPWISTLVADWLIQQLARLGSFATGMLLGGVPVGILIVVAGLQPQIYYGFMKAIRRWTPWLAANPVVGSASPTEDDQAALTQWRMKGKTDPPPGPTGL